MILATTTTPDALVIIGKGIMIGGGFMAQGLVLV